MKHINPTKEPIKWRGIKSKGYSPVKMIIVPCTNDTLDDTNSPTYLRDRGLPKKHQSRPYIWLYM